METVFENHFRGIPRRGNHLLNGFTTAHGGAASSQDKKSRQQVIRMIKRRPRDSEKTHVTDRNRRKNKNKKKQAWSLPRRTRGLLGPRRGETGKAKGESSRGAVVYMYQERKPHGPLRPLALSGFRRVRLLWAFAMAVMCLCDLTQNCQGWQQVTPTLGAEDCGTIADARPT